MLEPWHVAELPAIRDKIADAVRTEGAVLLRGLPLKGPADFAHIADELLANRATMAEPFVVRNILADNVYAAADWPEHQEMCLHPEQSYRRTWPGALLFGCVAPAEDGGATIIGDTRAILAALPTELVGRLRTEGWLLRRNYRTGFGMRWQDVLGVDTPAAAEDYCRANDIGYEWLPGGGLRTEQHRPAVHTHPVTGEECWFNQVAFLNGWSLPELEREILAEAFDSLPFDTYYGNGDPIDAATIDLINKVAAAHAVPVRWTAGDVLLIDNMLVSHGREPYQPPRDIVVALGDLAGTDHRPSQ